MKKHDVELLFEAIGLIAVAILLLWTILAISGCTTMRVTPVDTVEGGPGMVGAHIVMILN